MVIKNKLPRKDYRWMFLLITIMILTSAFTLLDAFVIPKSYVVVSQESIEALNSNTQPEPAGTENIDQALLNSVEKIQTDIENSLLEEEKTEVIITDHSYTDENISINIEVFDENGIVFYVADIQISDVSYFKTAFANDSYGKNITQTTSAMAQANNAIFAINGDYYGFRDTGLIIRNGVLYRDISSKTSEDYSLTVDSVGSLEIVDTNEVDGSSLIEAGIVQSFTFGPTLVINGQVFATQDTSVSQKANPRTAIGQISPLHYIFIVVDGRSDESLGMTLTQLANEFVKRGVTVAYNLDGGGSAAMWFNGSLINNPSDGHYYGERNISDIIYIGY
jgi:exopolysaccharide biosynthesis protein